MLSGAAVNNTKSKGRAKSKSKPTNIPSRARRSPRDIRNASGSSFDFGLQDDGSGGTPNSARRHSSFASTSRGFAPLLDEPYPVKRFKDDSFTYKYISHLYNTCGYPDKEERLYAFEPDQRATRNVDYVFYVMEVCSDVYATQKKN